MKHLTCIHIFLWIFADPVRFKPNVKMFLENPDVDLFISPIMPFEIPQKLGERLITEDKEIKNFQFISA